jgi:hypothetical protein
VPRPEGTYVATKVVGVSDEAELPQVAEEPKP